jgi:hypothetical protein
VVIRLRRWLPVITVAALLGAAMVAAVYANPRFESGLGQVGSSQQPVAPPTFEPPTEEPPPTSGGASDASPLPAWVGYLVGALCIVAVVALVGALLWQTLRDRLTTRRTVVAVVDPEEVRRRAQERIRAAVDEGLTDLDVADRDPRRAVIACWVRLEAAAAAAGTAREPGDTSSELVERMLAEHAITGPVLAGFAAVYREARFATHVVDEAMREQARAALRQVRDELIRGAAADAEVHA